jgi:hypothetical protein
MADFMEHEGWPKHFLPDTTMSNAIPSHQHVTIATFEHLEAGESLQSYLASHGLPSNLRDERSLQRWWFLSPTHAAIHLDVPESIAQDALGLIKRWDLREQLSNAMVEYPLFCPECGMSRIQYPNMTRRFLLPTLIAQVLTRLRITDLEFYCEDCHHTWAPKNPEDPEDPPSDTMQPPMNLGRHPGSRPHA